MDRENLAAYEPGDGRITRAQAGLDTLVVFWDQAGNLRLADVFHRYEAAQRLSDRVTFPCLIYAGSRRDVEEHTAICNARLQGRGQARHGPPMTRADKQAAIRRLLGLHPDWPDREIGWRVGCSPTTVSTPEADRERCACERTTSVPGREGVQGILQPCPAAPGD